jgi:archaemetzincin
LNDTRNITLISFGYFEKDFLENIADAIKQQFLLPVNIKEGRLDLSEFYDPGRRQYNGTSLLKEVSTLLTTESIKSLGLFNVDLYIPILTYIFGQAYLKGQAGIASTYRLKNELYGMKQDEALLRHRFRKVSIHELGHSFGLIHCHTPLCVMKSSTYVEDIDLKDQSFCIKCRDDLGGYLK